MRKRETAKNSSPISIIGQRRPRGSMSTNLRLTLFNTLHYAQNPRHCFN